MKRSEDPCRDPASEERDDWAVEPVAAPTKERPILFSGPMVRALLDDSKTQTRRIVNLTDSGRVKAAGSTRNWHLEDPNAVLACPYGQPGDRLWVREAWRASSAHNHLAPSKIPVGDSVEYLADPERIVTGKGRPSIVMPRWASRITLEITAVRVERLQEINSHDAIAEGIRLSRDECYYGSQNFMGHQTAASAYAELWESINGPGSWDANPFVWVVEFRRHAR